VATPALGSSRARIATVVCLLASEAGRADGARRQIYEARRPLDPRRVDRWISENVERRVGPE
jgi:hypothetical protein